MSDGKNTSLNILVVDDEEFSRKFLGRVLESIGITNTTSAVNGEEALKALQSLDDNHHERIDLIICDIEMPNMSGYELVRRLRYGEIPAYKNIPIIMLTGKDSDKNVRSARIHKIGGFLIKPPQAEPLKLMIEQCLAD
jgi:two-component system chemotaxis response regulator CheY